MKDFTEQIERIKLKLKKAKETDSEFKVFGAKSHQYEIGKPVDASVVEEFELKYGVELPNCYKSFITQFGNSGSKKDRSAAGPFYGIYAFGTSLEELFHENAELNLRRECILDPKQSSEDWLRITEKIEEEDVSDEVYDQELARIYGGVLPLGSQGCTYVHGLIITGAHKGRVVNLDMDCHQPRFTFEANFLDWYERWLDEVISGDLMTENSGWFGYTIGGSEEKLVEKYLNESDENMRIELLSGILVKSKLNADSYLKLLRTYVTQAAQAAQAAVSPKSKLLQVLCKFDYQSAKPLLEEYAEKDFLSVLKFVFWYAKDRSDDWFDLIAEKMPTIEDSKAFSFCNCLLKESGRDYGYLLLPFARSGDEEIRVTALYNLGLTENKAQYLDVFIEALSHPTTRIAHSSLQALQDVKDERLLPHYKSIALRYPEDGEYYMVSNLNHRLKDYGLDNLSIQDESY